MDTNFIVFLFIVFIAGCNTKTTPEITQENKPANVDSTTIELITLTREQVFNDRNESDIYLPGSIRAFDIDAHGNVYIASIVPGNVGIYIFNSRGEFINKLGQYGRGPGDFETIISFSIDENYLHAFDSRLQKITTYSVRDHEFVSDNVLDTRKLSKLEGASPLSRGKGIYAIQGGDVLLAAGVYLVNDLNKDPYISYYKVNKTGEIEPHQITQIERYIYYNGGGLITGNDISERPFTAPFTRTSRTAVSQNGYIYSSWTDEIEIRKVHVDSGVVDTIRFPVEKAIIDLDEIEISDDRIDVMKEQGLPKKWPALYTLEVDDHEQLWIATITESDSTYDWFVVEKNGDIRGRFTLKGHRADNFVRSKPRIKIKNGFFYEHQYDYWDGVDQIVRYSITYPN